ncbi:MAG TPA: hypothetical protein VFZ47_00500 [Chitinophagaceae bacterium]
MKKLFVFILTSICLLSFTACVTSLQPLVTYDKIISDQRITGNWTSNDNNDLQNLVIKVELLSGSTLMKSLSKSELIDQKAFTYTGDAYKDSILFKNAYLISYKENGATYNLVAALMKSGKNMFMDVHPAYMYDSTAPDTDTSPYDFNNDYLPGFTIAKVNFTANGVTLNFVDGELIENLTKEGKIKLKYESNALFGTFLITASSRDLQSFLEKYGDDERIFNKKTTVTLIRQPEHS